MNRILLLTAAAALALTPIASADEVSKNAKIEEMLQMTNMSQLLSQTMEQVKAMQVAEMEKLDVPPESRAQMKVFEQKLMDLLESRMNWDRLKPLYVRLYSETFTEEELDGIISFYRTPAGQAMLQKMPLLMQKSMGVVQETLGDLLPQIQKMAEEMKQGTAPAPGVK